MPTRGGRADLDARVQRSALALLPAAQGALIPLASKGAGIALLLLVPLVAAFHTAWRSRQAAVSSLVVGSVTLFLLETGIVSFQIPLQFGPPILTCMVQAATYMVVKKIFKTKNSTHEEAILIEEQQEPLRRQA